MTKDEESAMVAQWCKDHPDRVIRCPPHDGTLELTGCWYIEKRRKRERRKLQAALDRLKRDTTGTARSPTI